MSLSVVLFLKDFSLAISLGDAGAVTVFLRVWAALLAFKRARSRSDIPGAQLTSAAGSGAACVRRFFRGGQRFEPVASVGTSGVTYINGWTV